MKFTEFELTERFDSAYMMASELHRKQKRKNIPAPFMAHLFSVSALVCENIGFYVESVEEAEEMIMTAILHDTIEDQGGAKTYDKLRERFGEKIADNVMLLSDAVPAEDGTKLPKEERNRLYLEKMEKAPLGIVVISCCDKIHNLRTMEADYMVAESKEKFWSAFTQSPEATIANYCKMEKHYANRLGEDCRLVKVYHDVLQKVSELV